MDKSTELQTLLDKNTQRSACWEIVKCIFILLPIISLSAWGLQTKTISDQLIFKRIQGPNVSQENISRHGNTSCNDQDRNAEDKVESKSSMFILYMEICSCTVSLVSIPVWGVVSDKRGRSIVMVACSIGALVKTSALLAVAYTDKVPLWVLLLGEALHSIFGSSHGFIMASAAFIGDSIEPNYRTIVMILYDFVLLCNTTMLQYTVGILISKYGFTPFLICSMASNVILIIYVITIFSRCLKQNIEQSTEALWHEMKRFLTQTLTTFLRKRFGFKRMALFFITGATLFDNIARYGFSAVFTIYSLAPPLCWASETIGIYNAVSFACSAVLSLIVGLTSLRIGASGWLVATGMVSTTLQYLATGLATKATGVFIGAVIGGLHILVPATSRTIVCNLVHANEMGAALGGFVSVGSFASLLGHAIFNPIYAATLAFFKPLCFFLAAAVDVVGIIFVGAYGICQYKTRKITIEQN